jgi:predicted ATPase
MVTRRVLARRSSSVNHVGGFEHVMSFDSEAPYLIGLKLLPAAVEKKDYPFNLPAMRTLDLRFLRPVTFLVGENGTGKSTVLEALAELCGFPASGGGRNEFGAKHGPEPEAALTTALRPVFRKRPKDGFFFRGEFQSYFASLLDQRRQDPWFIGDPYARYGGQSLHTRSHGEAFLAVFRERISDGLYLFDEPESALSPQRQLTLLAHMAQLVDRGRSQFVIATHSPILLTFPNAAILDFNADHIRSVQLQETDHYQITKGILESPERYWKHLKAGG